MTAEAVASVMIAIASPLSGHNRSLCVNVELGEAFTVETSRDMVLLWQLGP